MDEYFDVSADVTSEVEEGIEITGDGDYVEEGIEDYEDLESTADTVDSETVEQIIPEEEIVEPETVEEPLPFPETVEVGEEVEEFDLSAEDDFTEYPDSAALEVANLSIAGGEEPEEVNTADPNDYTQILTDMQAELESINSAVSSAELQTKLDELNDNILTMNQNLVIASQNQTLIAKFSLGFTVAIFGALIIFFLLSKFR